ncbi:MAG: 1,4-dihydroxy-2-naphthoate octaprenyltransferase [Gammaproteobacteria bacterium]
MTLSIAVVPVLIGNTLARADIGKVSVAVMLLTLASAVLIQIATNLYNDAADSDRGADDKTQRLGPPRVTAQGWLSPAEVKRAAKLSFALSFLPALYLIAVGGWPILAVGVASIWAGWAYTGGAKPLAYLGGAELFVLLFFGIVSVAGSFYLQTGYVNAAALLFGAAIGLPASAVLVVNNYRDIDGDRLAGKKTLAVRLGRTASKIEYALLLTLPYGLLLLSETFLSFGLWAIIPALALPWAVILTSRFWREKTGPGLNRLLIATTRFHAGLGALLCVAILAGSAL